mmetsp:Transcript_37500/g.120298  ORF Transcript_37500/g.120298 Transcript_37500/m.120298 type:complete len:130 (-) Transcript_37500:311-700(-)|eukprot:CAMPEP_0118893456 /NCGR_PEP_ID=MMETSP1166-20130328/2657_1 /TAXON_ID=1104430 /ORGANISM="Chrysoreinhardia sp, Strain CCMP3193" /LENGTH=129 /DNA_ID=CAMNT_0006832267 /DNA_START=28 /DNA_END=417 /DNA_ORIENTATION=-
MAEADLCVREEEDWLVVGHDEEPEFQVEAPFESDEFFPPPPFAEMMDASFSTERQEARTQEARTAFLAEAKRFDDFFLVDREMCEATKFDIAAWFASWPVKELVAASTVIVTLKILTAITNRVTAPRLL